MDSKVSIILPTHNRDVLLPRAIKSVLNQTFKDFELIIVDDGSTDNTEETIKKFQGKDKRIVYIKNKKNRGAAVSRNKGIKVAKGEYIAFQDSDDEWTLEKLEKQIKIFQRLPNTFGVIYSDALVVNKNGEEEHLSTLPIQYKKIFNKKTLDYQGLNVFPPSVLMKKECFSKVGFFDERLPAMEDLDFFTRLSQHYKFYYLKEPLFIYHKEKEGISANNYYLFLARKILLKKYFGKIKKEKKFLSRQYYNVGFFACLSSEMKTGKKYLYKSIKVYPLGLKTLIIFLFSLLGYNIFTSIIMLKRKFF